MEKEGRTRVYRDSVMKNRVIFYDKEGISQVNLDYFSNMSVLYDIE